MRVDRFTYCVASFSNNSIHRYLATSAISAVTIAFQIHYSQPIIMVRRGTEIEYTGQLRLWPCRGFHASDLVVRRFMFYIALSSIQILLSRFCTPPGGVLAPSHG